MQEEKKQKNLKPKSKLLPKSTKIKKSKLPPSSEKPKKKTKMNRLALKEEKSERAIVYVGHLPYGFDEQGLKEFFSQYGDVLNVRVARSKKTGRSKGYGWIEFPFKEVAEIAAKSMNNHVTQGRRLVCEVVQDSKPIFNKKTTKKFKFIDWQKKFRKERNLPKTPEKRKYHIEKLLKREEEKRKTLKEMNIKYDFPGFSSQIQKYKQKHGISE